MISDHFKLIARRAMLYSQKLPPFSAIIGPQHDLKPLVPSILFAVTGGSVDMFAQRMTRYGRHIRSRVVADFTSSESTISSRGRLSSPAMHDSGKGQLRFERSNLTHHMSIRVASPIQAANPRILCIGDSLSWQGTLSALNTKLTASGMEPEFIGTYREIGGLPSEARSSWQAANFTGQLAGVNSDGSGMTYPIDVEEGSGQVGTTQEYLDLAEDPAVYGQRWQYNPFLRRATAADDPSVVRRNFVFDLAFYLDRFGFAAPDIVLIALGTNDVRNQPLGTGTRQVADAMDIIHRQTRAALPNAKIGFVLNGFGSSTLWARMHPLIDLMLSRYSASDADGTFVLPAYLAVDPVGGYKPTPVDQQRHATHRALKVDHTHMGETGRQQWADMTYAFVVNNVVPDRSRLTSLNSD